MVRIVLDYPNKDVARAVSRAVSPDNFKAPSNMHVRSMWKDGTLIAMIEAETKLPTLIATVDDLLFCVTLAEKTLLGVKKLR